MDNSAGEGDTSVTSFPSPEPPNRSPAVALEPVVVHGLSSRAALRLDSLDLATACPSVCPSVCVTVILPEEDARGLCSPQNLRSDHPGHDGRNPEVLAIRRASEHKLELDWDGAKSGGSHDFGATLPLVLRW